MAKAQQRFFICETCGNMVGLIKDSGSPLVCCGKEMKEMVPNTVDASKEKHVPVISVDGNVVTVTIGSAPHPMIDAHYIEWVYIQTEKGGQRKNLYPNDKPEATFILTDDDKLIAAFEYCNLHGLWKASV
ncbi:MAG: desulfoferrodoxin family protein [Clostridia bacterium]